jgi:hypothetical protein
MPEIRGQIHQRHQHEATQVQAGMGNLQTFLITDLITHEEQIDIQETRSSRNSPHPPGSVFGLQGCPHDLCRGQTGGDLHHEIQKSGLVATTHRLRLVDRRHPRSDNTLFCKHFEACGQLAGAVAQVGTQAQKKPPGVPGIVADDGSSAPSGPLCRGALTLSEIVCYLSASLLSPDS